MAGLNNGEVTAVQGRDHTDLQSFSNGDNRGIDGSETEVGVPLDQFGDPTPIFGGQVNASQFALL